ncbi:PREDICTED: dipeptidyl aminopeptidase BI-like isoform X2 [Brassica oleracea var. oleracea]|uniref:Peptidase S9A N-terminal domain-containing protein n=1 Tax=Brassica oleracea var. oleracea TaxID=109376 RepID=A0A0D3CPQ6_BRAOL|nr:PREDICTED: dipeptidyl aminopeptidase BI-like isoform X2 [Brassica oleracea var. oleracea]
MEYAQHCMRLIADNKAEPSVYDTMPTGPDAPPEHIILDENIKAQEYDYYSIGAFKASPDHKLVAYAEDTKGVEIYTVNVIDSEALKSLGEPLKGRTCYLQWAGLA